MATELQTTAPTTELQQTLSELTSTVTASAVENQPAASEPMETGEGAIIQTGVSEQNGTAISEQNGTGESEPQPTESESDTGVASKKQGEGGFECEFVDNPPSVLQTECLICLLVLREPYQVVCCGKSFCRSCIQRVQFSKQCPHCKEERIVFPNKGLQQSLYQLKVRCTHQKEGCKWTGELGALDNHLNLNPQPASTLEGCSYIVVDCRYRFAGCTARLPRKEMQAHLQENREKHFTLLEGKYNCMSRNQANFQHCLRMPPQTFTMSNYHKHLQQDEPWEFTFYTDQSLTDTQSQEVSSYSITLPGYKMCLKVVSLGLGTLSIRLYIMKGKFDDKLKWGVQFTPMEVKIEIVSPASWEPNKSVSIRIPNGGNFVSRRTSSMMLENAYAIKLEEMSSYLKNDSVKLIVSNIKWLS